MAHVAVESKVLKAAYHVLVSSVETKQGQDGVNMGPSCTALPCTPGPAFASLGRIRRDSRGFPVLVEVVFRGERTQDVLGADEEERPPVPRV